MQKAKGWGRTGWARTDILFRRDPRPLPSRTLTVCTHPFPRAKGGRWATAARPGQSGRVIISTSGTATTRLEGKRENTALGRKPTNPSFLWPTFAQLLSAGGRGAAARGSVGRTLPGSAAQAVHRGGGAFGDTVSRDATL